MDKQTIEQKVELVIEEFASTKGMEGVNTINFDELIANSLDLMRFLVLLEEQFDIYISQEYLLMNEFSNKQTVVDIVSSIMNKN